MMTKLEQLIKELCPNGVEYKKLQYLAEISTGSSNTNEAIEGGKYPFFVRSQELLYKDEYEFDETAIITAGDGVGVGKVLHFYSGKEFVKKNAKANIVCGLGNPERFCSDLQDFGIEIGHKFFFKDHSKAFAAQFEKIIQNRPQETFVISEKDAARLPAEFIQKNEKSQIFVASQTTEISTEIAQNLF